ncbi:MAG: T9SS type A sorting domain-containing protein [candidate division KSB1 bacterium]|nr:T9SS type A sorting domain-containing protein [candidate division KSB1 bacterium]MDZ7369353.1 T9SS type A sorting domain-containing protein [candidate division KSB1 bacterium]MDZ7407392.1 T9SS type A sorting domain-containing protein [candidate division KSB1 bacterium]
MVLFQLEADRKDQPFEVTFRSIDRYLILTNHGLTKIRVNLNGNQFSLLSRPASAAQDLNAYQMPSEGTLTIDLQKYLRDGENLIRFDFDGPAGTRAEMMLIDEAHQIDHALELLPIPAEYQLSQNYPNPFNPTTMIRFSVPARAANGAAVQLRIYNMLGELVQTLVDERMFPGNYAITWNGRNLHGQTVAAGIYVYQLITGEFKQTKRMVILR